MATFNPISVFGSTTLAVTGTAGSVTLPTGNGNQLLLQNTGTNLAWWVVGATTATAANTTGASTPIVAGAVILYTIDPGATVLSAISSATGTTTTLYATRCAGT